MADLPFALALGAGMLAAVNPCGFALLPAYLSLLVLGDDSPSRTVAVGRALAATAAMTAGFATFFGVFGLVIQPVAGQIQQHLPWFTIVLGLLIVTAGAWLLAGRQLSTFAPKLRRAPTITRSVPSMALFGTAYATASLGCTIAPFLAIVVSAFRSGSTVEGILLFAAYAAGMGLIVGVASLTVALTRTTAVTRLRRLGAIAPRLGGGLILLVGAYVAYYGWYEIRALRDPTTNDLVIDTAATAQRAVAGTLDAAGPAVIAVLFGTLLLAALLIRRYRRTRQRTGSRA
ncbi:MULTISPECIES: cytochrome c biogenesis CcdA family protein [Streptomyces]|uniref:Cytochrome C biogenesis protein transmembrane n=2 Tax=Streptomyces TaxID=1883 RepID=A0A100JSU1_STRSC|nr:MULTISPECIES: cytochrome c biogenesis protein CcdA [Streptomyces]KFG10148.1 cytochrome C biogenesis protein [Streptomyces scabiei]KND26418.1 cytochrome C biogenesis protein [Streptomyces stelliscabiei]MBE1594221.1 cytochrome c biogenesis protein CcdA [Streptomyces stelliscabiei]MDX2521169.1 cytochrome c biogenesis protein CcdA [Streptomyces stelliscabiei]MDX2836319.1 cytochrome c biogenesis protein CcdA [Streptomyces scabiei]